MARLTAATLLLLAFGTAEAAAQVSEENAVETLTNDTLDSLGATRSGVMVTSWPAYAEPTAGASGPGNLNGLTASGFDAALDTGFEVWFGGVYTSFESDLNGLVADGDVLLGQAGLGYRFDNDLRLGLMLAAETIDGEIGAIDTDATGFLAGPYLTAGLTEHVQLEALALGGVAYNEYQAPGAARVEFDSGRALLALGAGGEWEAGAFSLRPSARVTYYAERNEAFSDGAGNDYDAETTSLGQLRIGQEVGYALDMGGVTAQPFIGVEGVWSFHQSAARVNGRSAAPDELSATALFGVNAVLGDATLRLNGRLDGLGSDDFDAATAEAQLSLPLY